jgi:DNA ligase (NAD+)
MTIIDIEKILKQFEQESNNDIIQILSDDPRLEEYVEYCNKKYRDGSPIVSDNFYDNALIIALKNINPENDFLNTVEPESDEVFGKTVELPERMLSTNKAYSIDVIEKWTDSVIDAGKKLNIPSDQILFKVTPKLDGYASYYDGNNLYTRGNGLYGSDITRALNRGLLVKNGKVGKGEIVVYRQWFSEKLSEKYENSRNIIASVIKEGELDNDIKETIDSSSVIFVPFSELESWVGPKEELLKNIELLWDEFVTDSRFDTDGLVIEAIDDNIKNSMGFTNHHFRWQIAYKKNTEYHHIKVIGIIPQTSKTGRITPVVELEPTRVSGVTISRATGHHYGNLIEKGIDVGSILKVYRSGLVIPFIDDVIVPAQSVTIPESCPSCNHPTLLDGDNLLCTNNHDCPAQIAGTLEYFFKTIGNCDGFGEKIIEKLVDNGIRNVVEIYRNPEEVIESSGIYGKIGSNLVNQLKKSTQIQVEDWRWLAAFSIPNVGKAGCEKILKHYKLETIFDLSVQDIMIIDGFAERTATILIDTLKLIRQDIEELLPLFNLKRTIIGESTTSNISGKNIVFTGTLSVKRSDLEKQAKDLGAKVGSAVSSKTDYLVCGENVGSTKTESARKHGVTVLSESEYLELIS